MRLLVLITRFIVIDIAPLAELFCHCLLADLLLPAALLKYISFNTKCSLVASTLKCVSHFTTDVVFVRKRSFVVEHMYFKRHHEGQKY